MLAIAVLCPSESRAKNICLRFADGIVVRSRNLGDLIPPRSCFDHNGGFNVSLIRSVTYLMGRAQSGVITRPLYIAMSSFPPIFNHRALQLAKNLHTRLPWD